LVEGGSKGLGLVVKVLHAVGDVLRGRLWIRLGVFGLSLSVQRRDDERCCNACEHQGQGESPAVHGRFLSRYLSTLKKRLCLLAPYGAGRKRGLRGAHF